MGQAHWETQPGRFKASEKQKKRLREMKLIQ